MGLVETAVRRVVAGTAEAYGATATLDFRENFAPTVNDAPQAEFAAGICSALVGPENVDRQPPLNMASEDFSFMLQRVPGCYINIGNGLGEGGCEVHHPGYDFNDAAPPLGAAFFVRAVEAKLALVTSA
jgi:hippurate hydrolase